VTALLGALFIGVKLYEWHLEAALRLLPGPNFVFPAAHAGPAQLFFWLYFGMTGLHAVHLTIGVGLCLIIAVLAWRGAFSREHHAAVEVVGLYWHYVDIVWLFLYPLLYLGGRHLSGELP
jgi:cytochrome c oxidase subunit 3